MKTILFATLSLSAAFVVAMCQETTSHTSPNDSFTSHTTRMHHRSSDSIATEKYCCPRPSECVSGKAGKRSKCTTTLEKKKETKSRKRH